MKRTKALTLFIWTVIIVTCILLITAKLAGATGDSDCPAGSSWVRIYLHQDATTPNIYGWIPFTNKCGETYLIPIDPRIFVVTVQR
jgi:hypothetical protein